MITQIGMKQGMIKTQFGLYTFSEIHSVKPFKSYKAGETVQVTLMYQESIKDYQLVTVR